MRLLICGSRKYKGYEFVRNTLDRIMEERGCCGKHGPIDSRIPITVIHGGAQGVDWLADQWAVVNWLHIEEYKAKWDVHGLTAGPIRNQQMIDMGKPDLVVAFPGGRGTKDLVQRAKSKGIEVIEVADETTLDNK